ncbi:MAG: phage tail protein [Caldilineaceae bacterium]
MKREAIARLLPELFQRTLPAEPNVLSALLGVMETQQMPVEAVLAELDRYLDADQTPARFVPFLAQWVGMDIFLEEDAEGNLAFAGGLGRMRDLILAANSLARLRGTKQGLIRMLETATGLTGFVIMDPREKPYHIVVQCPAVAAAQERLIRRIVELEKPAYVTFELVTAE